MSDDVRSVAQREMANALYAKKGYADWDYAHELAGICLTAFISSEAVRAALVEVLGAHLAERIAWHGPYGATSEEQWQMDTEKQFVRELQDGRLLDAILAALAPEAT